MSNRLNCEDLENDILKLIDQFGFSYLEIRGFSHFNKILLNLVDISNVFLS